MKSQNDNNKPDSLDERMSRLEELIKILSQEIEQLCEKVEILRKESNNK